MDSVQDNVTDHTDDDSYELVNRFDHSCDESYEFVGSEESYNRTADFEEDPYAESETQRNGAEPSGSGADVLDEEYQNPDDSSPGNEDSEIETNDPFGHLSERLSQVLGDTGSPQTTKIPVFREDMELKDVVEKNALHLLPAKSLCRFRAVSKQWYQRIAAPIFPYQQSLSFRSTSGYFHKYQCFPQFMTLNWPAYGVPSPTLNFLPETVVIRSSCNGLLFCNGIGIEKAYYVCNPATREWEVLPRPEYYHGIVPSAVLSFEPSEDRNFQTSYRVICPVTVLGSPITFFEIYSSVTRAWKCSTADCVELGDSELKNGFYANGFSYWETETGELLAFDVKNEFCGFQELPTKRIPDSTLSYLDGELCYVTACVELGNTCVIDIYRGMDMVLMRSIEVKLPRVLSGVRGQCRVLPCVNGDYLACVVGNGAFACCLKDQSVELIREEGIGAGAEFVPYVNSLIPLPPRE